MPCPICGANCRCRKRGPDGMCCSCHRHKVRRLLRADFAITNPEWMEALEKHKQDIEATLQADRVQLELKLKP